MQHVCQRTVQYSAARCASPVARLVFLLIPRSSRRKYAAVGYVAPCIVGNISRLNHPAPCASEDVTFFGTRPSSCARDRDRCRSCSSRTRTRRSIDVSCDGTLFLSRQRHNRGRRVLKTVVCVQETRVTKVFERYLHPGSVMVMQ